MVKTSEVEQGQTIAELRRELEARNRDLAALYDVTAAASQSLEIKPVLDEVVRKITDIFAFDSVSVFLFDPKTEVLNLMAAAGIHEIQALPRAFRRGHGLTGRVAETGRYLIFEDVPSRPLSAINSIQNLLPDDLFLIGWNAFLAAFLNGCKPVLEGVHIAWRSAFAF